MYVPRDQYLSVNIVERIYSSFLVFVTFSPKKKSKWWNILCKFSFFYVQNAIERKSNRFFSCVAFFGSNKNDTTSEMTKHPNDKNVNHKLNQKEKEKINKFLELVTLYFLLQKFIHFALLSMAQNLRIDSHFFVFKCYPLCVCLYTSKQHNHPANAFNAVYFRFAYILLLHWWNRS